jgi:putative transposase
MRPADQETPATCYAPSPRPMPDRVPPPEYPDRFEVRYVSAHGGIRWNSRWVNVSTVCVGEHVWLEEIDLCPRPLTLMMSPAVPRRSA